MEPRPSGRRDLVRHGARPGRTLAAALIGFLLVAASPASGMPGVEPRVSDPTRDKPVDDVGSTASGQDSVVIEPGLDDDATTFAVDGEVITDMAAVGTSPTYYDLSNLGEISVATGDPGVENAAGGVSVNLVTKRGSNDPRGSAHQAVREGNQELFGMLRAPPPDVSRDLETGDGRGGLRAQVPSSTPGNSIDEIVDVGLEVGGPLVRYKWWVWALYGRDDVKQFAYDGAPEGTLIETEALTFNLQLTASSSVVASWQREASSRSGRRPGSDFAPSATWDQTGPTEFWKAEDTLVVTPDLYLTGVASFFDRGFRLSSLGGQFPAPATTEAELARQRGEPLLDEDGLWKNGFFSGVTDRDTRSFQGNGSLFFFVGPMNHEIKIGASSRSFDKTSSFGWPGGRNLANLSCQALATCGYYTRVLGLPGDDLVEARRSGSASLTRRSTAAWLQDTITGGHWTVNVGLRYDRQTGENDPGVATANTVFPDLLPEVQFPGRRAGFEWTTLSPRLGGRFALGPAGRTLVQWSLARFAAQLESATVERLNSIFGSSASLAYRDADGDNTFDPGEPAELVDFRGFDPLDPALPVSPNETDSGLDPPITDEITLDVEHAILPELVVRLDLTARRTSGILEEREILVDEAGVRRVATRDDYQLDRTVVSDGIHVPHLPDGTPWTADFYRFRPGLRRTGGTFLTNGDRETEYLRTGLSLTKRLSNHWRARGYAQYGKAQWHIPDSFLRFDDPTTDPLGRDDDGALFVVRPESETMAQEKVIQATWSASFSGMYEIAPNKPWGFNVAGSLFVREGYPLPYSYRAPTRDGRLQAAAVTRRIDEFRADNLEVLDLRVEKELALAEGVRGVLSVDVFNVFNETYAINRNTELSGLRANWLTESAPPRTFQFAFRLGWR